jgi:hypothetical protein
MKFSTIAPALLFLLSACDSTSSMSGGAPMPALDGGVVYEVTLAPMWNATSHPMDYPKANLLGGPHFSGLIGASHAAGYAIFSEGTMPSPGLERLSEEGKHTPLDAEIRAAIAAGTAGTLFETDAVKDLSKPATTKLAVSEAFPMVSAVAMIAPSPDWFAGASNVALREGGRWLAVKEVTLFAYDSGGDDGTTYTAADQDTNPKKPTRLNDAAPFKMGGQRVPVGKLTFRRI